MMAFFTYQLQ